VKEGLEEFEGLDEAFAEKRDLDKLAGKYVLSSCMGCFELYCFF
jgi:hypothetical protein